MGGTARSRVLITVFRYLSLFLHLSLFSSFLVWDFILKHTLSMGQQTFVPAVQSRGGSSISIYSTYPKDSYRCQWTIPYSTAKRITVSKDTLSDGAGLGEGRRQKSCNHLWGFFLPPQPLRKKVQSQTPKTYGLNMIIIN